MKVEQWWLLQKAECPQSILFHMLWHGKSIDIVFTEFIMRSKQRNSWTGSASKETGSKESQTGYCAIKNSHAALGSARWDFRSICRILGYEIAIHLLVRLTERSLCRIFFNRKI